MRVAATRVADKQRYYNVFYKHICERRTLIKERDREAWIHDATTTQFPIHLKQKQNGPDSQLT